MESWQTYSISFSIFQQIKDLTKYDSRQNLDLALKRVLFDCLFHTKRMLNEYGGAERLKICILVLYEPTNPIEDKKEPCQKYLSGQSTIILHTEKDIYTLTKGYMAALRRFNERYKEHNAKFIRERSCLRLAEIY